MKKTMIALLGTLFLFGAQAAASNFYIIPDSNTRRLTEQELWEWQYDALGYAFNEIFARHGYHFEPGGKYESYFMAQKWYQENEQYPDNQKIYDRLMNDVEWHNERLIKDVRAQMRALGTYNEDGKALPQAVYEPEIVGAFSNFKEIFLKPNTKLSVYSGPGKQYYRGANGKAMASTNGRIYAGGWENGYLMIMYWTNEDSVRVGFTPAGDIRGEADLPGLNFEYEDAQVAYDCKLTDDPAMTRQVIRTIKAGESVIYLGTYVNSSSWAYVETQVDGKPARGFIPADSVILPQTDEN